MMVMDVVQMDESGCWSSHFSTGTSGSVREIRRFDSEPAQFGNFLAFSEPDFAEVRGNPGAKTPAVGSFALCRVAQNFAHLFFHAAAVSLGAPLQPGLHFVFDIADDQLPHVASLSADIMIS